MSPEMHAADAYICAHVCHNFIQLVRAESQTFDIFFMCTCHCAAKQSHESSDPISTMHTLHWTKNYEMKQRMKGASYIASEKCMTNFKNIMWKITVVD